MDGRLSLCHSIFSGSRMDDPLCPDSACYHAYKMPCSAQPQGFNVAFCSCRNSFAVWSAVYSAYDRHSRAGMDESDCRRYDRCILSAYCRRTGKLHPMRADSGEHPLYGTV